MSSILIRCFFLFIFVENAKLDRNLIRSRTLVTTFRKAKDNAGSSCIDCPEAPLLDRQKSKLNTVQGLHYVSCVLSASTCRLCQELSL